MKKFLLFVLCLIVLTLLNACAITVPAPPSPDAFARLQPLFRDQSFAPPTAPINAADVFALSDEMKRYLRVDIAKQLRAKGPQDGLFEALYREGQLKLYYDTEETRNAAETFSARSGNCLSLVIMTAAFAKELGLRVRFQRVFVEESWSRTKDMYFAAGHVNLVLGAYLSQARNPNEAMNAMTIDFFPPETNRANFTQSNVAINEQTIIAMYMNNRAAESLVRGKTDEAYWWAREAIKQDADFLTAFNTLGVIYKRHGIAGAAEAVFSYVIEHEPRNVQALSNLAILLREQNRDSEAGMLTARLDKVQPYPPYYFFDQGQAAYQRGEYDTAKQLFAREVKRAEYNHEFQFWLALAYYKLGDNDRAKTHMSKAMENSTTRKEHDLYAAKLDKLTAARDQVRQQ